MRPCSCQETLIEQAVKVQTRGRITLPKDVRASLDADAGDEVVLREIAPGRFELKVRTRTAAIEKGTGPSRLNVRVRPKRTDQLDLPL